MPAEAIKDRKIITDNVVLPMTGKTIDEWFAILDERGAKKLDHLAIFNLIASTEGLRPLGEWNHNLLATSYEWDRGLKQRGQKADGFEISVSKTVSVPIGKLYRGFVDDEIRAAWLPGETINITKSTENKSARAVWSDGETRLSVDFYPKGDAKAQIVVQHMKIHGSDMAAQMKEYWAERLNRLKSILETI